MTVRAWACRKGGGALEQPPTEQLAAIVADPDFMVWVDVLGRSEADDRLLQSVFGLHPLVVEDIFQESQPKLEVHGAHVYLIVHSIDVDRSSPHDLDTVEVDVVFADHFILTHHDKAVRSIESVAKLVTESPELLRKGPAHVAHGILDRLIDKYVPLMERFDVQCEELELQVLERSVADVVERTFDLKRSLQVIRRIGLHQKAILKQLGEGRLPYVPEELLPFFRDVYDHFLRVTDLADGYRDIVGGALDAYLSVQSHRLNEVMKLLTVMSTIMLPLTFLTGLYGMNFQYMPELSRPWGYPAALALMAAVGTSMFVFFKRKRFL